MSQSTSSPAFHRTTVGHLTFYAFQEGINQRPLKPDLVRNAPPETVARALRDAGMPEGSFTLTFTIFGLERDGNLILFDAGFGSGGPGCTGLLRRSLEAAGFGVGDITDVFITHFHGDHILGLTRPEGDPAFPRATIHVPQPEWDFWMSGSHEAAAPERLRHAFPQARRVFDTLGQRVSRFGWGSEPGEDVRALDLAGHTPGHTGFEIASGRDSIVVAGDACNNPLVFARHPYWQAMFDLDGPKAARCRATLLSRTMRSNHRLALTHAPFPGIGTVKPLENGFQWYPAA